MKIRATLAAVVTAVFVCLGVVVPITPAVAAGVPPVALPSCAGESAPTGGWLLRDLVSTGTTKSNPADVRPRNYRLGEPCFDTVGFADPVLMVPVRMTDLAVPGSYAAGSEAAVCATDDPSNCGVFMGYGYLTATPSSVRLCFSFTGDNSPAQQITLRVGSGPAGSGATTGGGAVSTMKSTFSGGTVTCPAGSNAVSTYTTSGGIGTAPWEWRYGGSSPANSAWTGNMFPHGYDADTVGGTQAAQAVFGAGAPFAVPDTGEVVCSSNYSATDTTTYTLPGHTHGGSPGVSATPPTLDEDDEPDEWTVWQGYYPDGDDLTLSMCDYLVEVRFWICTYTGHSPLDYGCLEVRWVADQFRDRHPYPDGSDQESICALYPDTPGCFDVINPPYVDGTDFAEVCLPIPEDAIPEWLTLDWLLPWMGHFIGCLFTPVGGLDSGGWIAAAWANGPAGQLGDAFADLSAALEVDGGCGVLVDADVMGSPLVIDTCEWTWAGLGRTLLHWTILIFGCISVALFIFRTILSPIIRTRADVPFSEDK